MNRLLVIGASGRTGRQVLSQLPSSGIAVRALVRDPRASRFPSHVELVTGDLTIPKTIDRALHDVESVFLVWTAPRDTAAVVVERIAKSVRRVVYLSAPFRTPHPFFQASQPNPVSILHMEIERKIETSGCEWTLIRPGMFAANARAWWASSIRTFQVVRWPYLAATTAPIDERDIAAVAVQSLIEDGHNKADYILTGPTSLSQLDQISAIGRAIGRPVQIEEMSPDEARLEWLGRWPSPVVEMLLKSWAAAIGHPALVTPTVTEITGTVARSFEEWAIDHSNDFR